MGKRLMTAITTLLALALSVPAVFANIDNLSNMSAEWIRTGNRNASTDAADIVFYNPAGLTELSEGYHLNISNQTLIRTPEHSFDLGMGNGVKSYEQDSPDYFLPNVYGSYNKANWSVFGGIYIPGGGATVDYPTGSITTQLAGVEIMAQPLDQDLIDVGFNTMDDVYSNFASESLEATSIYLTGTVGGAYKINDMISIAAGARYINAKNTIKAQITPTLTGDAEVINVLEPGAIPEAFVVDQEATADGFGGILGVNINATDKMNLAIQYQSKVELDFKTKVNRDDLGIFVDGDKNRRDFPALLGLGAGYDISDKLYSEVNYSYWFQKEADWGKDDSNREISDMAGDAWSAGGTLAYKINPTFLVSAGTTYTKFDWGDMDGYYSANMGSCEVLYSDNWHVGTGFAWEFREAMKLNLSLGQTIWDDETVNYNGIQVETNNATTVVAIGIDMSF